jgi:hypothetical protein
VDGGGGIGADDDRAGGQAVIDAGDHRADAEIDEGVAIGPYTVVGRRAHRCRHLDRRTP